MICERCNTKGIRIYPICNCKEYIVETFYHEQVKRTILAEKPLLAAYKFIETIIRPDPSSDTHLHVKVSQDESVYQFVVKISSHIFINVEEYHEKLSEERTGNASEKEIKS